MLTNKTPWIILLVLWMIGSTWWHVCKIKQLCGNDPAPVETAVEPELYTTPAGADGFTIADGNLFRLNLPGNFSFAKSGANANMNSLGGSLETMVAYLKANPGRTLQIIGYYTPGETNTTTFPNLGLARAEGFKQYLVQQGIPASSLTTKGVERNLPFTAKGDSLVGGLDFAFSGMNPAPADTATTAPIVMNEPTTEKELAESQKFTSVFKPIDLYFPLGEATYIKTDETKKFFEEATKYLTEHKDKKLLLTGYTDNTGPDEMNLRLSRDRANRVKMKLHKLGIDSDQVIVAAKGEAEPKADNSTPSGRKANRRVTVVIQ
ncbi:OmpA family protein [Spirosoma radiotolerans]|uniref:Flagellar motor protein MotB n=1 Tax=Spirosoma radiotolerans TaxID=1379870 RepID=A0A0E3V7E5_9BACT|nr:OmpA family protein [Spirosoma radiotolerans]AKD55361.1 flagellar motor protein MotB [Spirosoma radiotolerans]